MVLILTRVFDQMKVNSLTREMLLGPDVQVVTADEFT